MYFFVPYEGTLVVCIRTTTGTCHISLRSRTSDGSQGRTGKPRHSGTVGR